MNTVLRFQKSNKLTLPEIYQGSDIRFSDSFVSCFIEYYSQPGDVVLDPFAGFGTTLYIAEKLGREGYGIEYLPDRVEYIRSIMQNKDRIICGSALDMDSMDLPPIDFSITSPPYMSRNDHKEYPFAGYRVTGAGYSQYLMGIQDVYRQLKRRLKPDAYAVVEISNIIHKGVLTTLAWDVAKKVSEVLTLEREIIIHWDSDTDAEQYGYGYDHSYCLIFRNSM